MMAKSRSYVWRRLTGTLLIRREQGCEGPCRMAPRWRGITVPRMQAPARRTVVEGVPALRSKMQVGTENAHLKDKAEAMLFTRL